VSSNSDTLETKANFNWHPKLHAHEGELLWFFLIRFADPTAGAVDAQLKKALEQAGLQHSCMYALYGYWDGLLRVWMTVGVKRKFLRLMKKKPNEFGVVDIRDFEVTAMYYMWHNADVDLLDEEEGPSLEQINALEETVRGVRGNVALLEPADREKLSENDLLIDRPPWPEGGIKLYIALDYTGTVTVQGDLEVSLVRQAIEGAGLGESCSLYVGAGFTQFLIRCIAVDYDAVLEQTESFYQQLRELYMKGLPLRPTTFVILHASEESDDLNVFESLSTPDEMTTQRLDLTGHGRENFSGLPGPERAHIHDLVVTIDERSLEDARLTGGLLGLLRGCVENDYTTVISSLWFLIDLEWLFREYVIRAWARHYGKDWPGSLKDRLKPKFEDDPKLEQILDVGPKEWNFGQAHRLATVSAELDSKLDALLESELGPNWQGRFFGLIELRNLAAHGSVRNIKNLTDLTGRWGIQVGEMIGSAAVYFLLDKLIAQTETKHDS